ncbi:hypothetical protein K440DRAFT_657403 [Wilcoxina mikolae CBS 423.85]|nr:hypothetical protein K440DRAFT_657403 [Wilcoxina mikolae CBS 423.85]
MRNTVDEYLEGQNHLGMALNCIKPVDPLNLSMIMDQNVGNFAFTPSNETRPITIGSRTFDVPKDIRVTRQTHTDGKLTTYQSGIELLQAATIDGTISCSFGIGRLGLGANTSFHDGHRKYAKNDRLYALYGHRTVLYRAAIPTAGLIRKIDAAYKQAGLELPEWDSACQDVVDAYADYFNMYGTHVITEVDYGWRYQLIIDCGKENAETSRNFKANISTQYSGILARDRFVAGHKESEQYKHYIASSNATCYILGDSPTLAFEASRIPDDPDAYGEWLADISDARNEALIKVKAESLALLYRTSGDAALKKVGGALESAFHHIATLGPTANLRRIPARVLKDSDWGAVNLISDNCRIEVPDVWPAGVLEMTTKRVRFGIIRVFQISHVDINIISDGGTIDVDLSHGNDGTQGTNTGWVALRLACGDLAVNKKTLPYGDGINGMIFRGLTAG